MAIIDNELLQKEREKIIKILDSNNVKRNITYQLVLAKLALTPYLYDDGNVYEIYRPYKNNWKSSISNYVLHPYQIDIIEHLEKKENLVVSAPTSFGKTTAIFEYISRNKKNLHKIITIIPTNSLKMEYFIKLQEILAETHKVIDNEGKIEDDNFCLVLTHEKFIECFLEYKDYIKDIDLVVIDEIYKLKNEKDEDRIYAMSLAYLTTIKIAKQFVFMGPFIQSSHFPGIDKDHRVLNYFYSPVLSEIYYIGEYSEENIIQNVKYNEKSMIYYSSKDKLGKAAIALANKLNRKNDKLVNYLIESYGKEICKNWYLVESLSKGIAINYNEIPNFIKDYMLNKYNQKDSGYNILLSTSTLLEGVNTLTKNLYITSGKNGKKKLTDFEFWNLVGRAGRLGEYKIGYIYYFGEESDFDRDNRYINLDNIWITEEENKLERYLIEKDEIYSYAENEKDIVQKLEKIKEKFELSNEDISYRILPTFGKINKFVEYMEKNYKSVTDEIKADILSNDGINLHNIFLKGITKKTKTKKILTSFIGYRENTILTKAFFHGKENKNAKIVSIITQGINLLKKQSVKSGEDLKLKINNLINTTFNLINNYIPNVYIPTVECLYFMIEKDKEFEENLKKKLNENFIKDIKLYKKLINESNVYETLAIIPSLEKILSKLVKEKNIEIKNTSDLRNFIISNKKNIESYIVNDIDKEFYEILIKRLKIKQE